MTTLKSVGKEWKRQWCAFRLSSKDSTLLQAVTELKTRLCCVLSGGTWTSVGKPGKQTRRKMVLDETVN